MKSRRDTIPPYFATAGRGVFVGRGKLISFPYRRRPNLPAAGVRVGIAAGLLLAVSGLPAHAQSGTWTGLGDAPSPIGNWNNPANWSPTSVPSAVADFGTVTVPPIPSTILIDTPTFIETIRFSGSTPYTVNI